MVKKLLFLILAVVSCFCLFGFTDEDNVESSVEPVNEFSDIYYPFGSITDLSVTRWIPNRFTIDRQADYDWESWGKFNILVEFDDGRSLVPDDEGYSLKIGYNLDEPDESYVSCHYSDVGWVVSYNAFLDNFNVVGGTDVTNPRLITYFECHCVPYDNFRGLYIINYDYLSRYYFSGDVFGTVKVANNLDLSDIRTVNIRGVSDGRLLKSLSFSSYSFVHNVFLDGVVTDYSADYSFIILDEDCNYNVELLAFLMSISGDVIPYSYSWIYPYYTSLNGDIPLVGTYYIDSSKLLQFVSSSGSKSGILNIPIECNGEYYMGFQISNNNSSRNKISLLDLYGDSDLVLYPSSDTVSFTFFASSDFGVNQDFYDWFTASTTSVAVEPEPRASNLSGVWQANSTLTYLDFTESVKFLVNGVWYNQMSVLPGYGPPDHYVLEFESYDFNNNLEYDVRAALWNADTSFWEFTTNWNGTIDFGRYDQIVGSSFYDWFTANFTYVGESTEVPPSDEELLGFFPRLFSTVQQAFDSFVIYTTGSGYNITIWTFVVTLLGISFIVWILKLIAGG